MHENGRHGNEDTNHDEVNQTKKNNIEKEKTKKTKYIQNRVQQALDLPVLCNINPRSVYNKCDEQAGAELCQAQFKLGLA